jgi:hypothetical protein
MPVLNSQIYYGASATLNLVYCDSAYTEDSGFSFSPVQQFSVTLWHSARLNHDSTIIAGDSARVFERV